MPTYGFAIDLRKCIGCHACTIACKAEHEIPVGVNRCWVKTVEKGAFPDTRRFFFPVLCNQCDEAPCARICPTSALFKRRDGIVDLHGSACIGCRACMEACPYDQLFIDPNTHTAEKCNFCANRVENNLLPACVSVCPTECRIFGDLDDPASEVARIVQREAFTVRKPEKGTGPKVFYLGAEESVIRPQKWLRVPPHVRKGKCTCARWARRRWIPMIQAPRQWTTTFTTSPGEPTWCSTFCSRRFPRGRCASRDSLVAGIRRAVDDDRGRHGCSIVLVSLLTAVVLIVDLEMARPERFYYILTRSNWRSWIVWGAWFLTAHGALSTLWLAAGWFGWDAVLDWLTIPAGVVALLATSYTGFLFAQGLARDLWQGPTAAIDLIAQSMAAGLATLLLVALLMRDPAANAVPLLGTILAASICAHLVILAFEHLLSPSPSRHHELAVRNDSARRLCAVVLGRRGRRRRHRPARSPVDCWRRYKRGDCSHRSPPRAGRGRRVEVHLGGGGAERPALMILS